MEGNTNTITIYLKLDMNLNFSDPQEDKQEAVPLDAEPIHPKEDVDVHRGLPKVVIKRSAANQ